MDLVEFNNVVKHFFHNKPIEKITIEEIEEFIEKNPLNYLGILFKLSKKKIVQNREILISSYFHNTLWIEYFLKTINKKEKVYNPISHADLQEIKKSKPLSSLQPHKDSSQETKDTENTKKKAFKTKSIKKVVSKKPIKNTKTIHTPLYTEDYFASQGQSTILKINKQKPNSVKIQTDNIEDIASMNFTSWLTNISKNNIEDHEPTDNSNNEEVLTVSMAQLYEEQGQIDKAIHIYEKIIQNEPTMEVSLTKKINQLKSLTL